MRICVVGTGYVGLVTGACLADFGMQVVCVDKLADKIAALERCEIPIYEPGLATLVRHNLEAGRLRFTSELSIPMRVDLPAPLGPRSAKKSPSATSRLTPFRACGPDA